MRDQVLPPFDKEMTTPIAQTLNKNGVSLILVDAADNFAKTTEGLTVALQSERCLIERVHRNSSNPNQIGRRHELSGLAKPW